MKVLLRRINHEPSDENQLLHMYNSAFFFPLHIYWSSTRDIIIILCVSEINYPVPRAFN